MRERAKKIVWKGGGRRKRKRKRKEGRAIQKICEENQKRSSVQRKRGLSKGQGENCLKQELKATEETFRILR